MRIGKKIENDEHVMVKMMINIQHRHEEVGGTMSKTM